MGADIVWQGIGANVVGAVLSAAVAVVTSLLVVGKTNAGAAAIAQQGRLENALAELTYCIQALLMQPLPVADELDEHPAVQERWLEYTRAKSRVAVIMQHGDLTDALNWLGHTWLREAWLAAVYERRLADAGQDVGMESRYDLDFVCNFPSRIQSPAPEHGNRANREIREWQQRTSARYWKLKVLHDALPKNGAPGAT